MLIGISNDTERSYRTVNAIVVAPDSLAMLFEHREFVLKRGKITRYVTGIAVLRHQFQRDLLTTACNQQGNMRFLDAFRLIDSSMYLVILALNVCLLLGPHRQNNLDRFAQLPQACWSIRILVAIGAILVLVPASPDAKVQTPMTQHVHRTRHLRQQRRSAITITGHHLTNAYPFRVACQRRRRGPRLECHFL